MGIFSKIFGSDKLELSDDDVQKTPENNNVGNTPNENNEPSPFLVDDDKDENQVKKD